MRKITGRAAVLVAPGSVAVQEVAVPEPADGEILTRNLAASICHGDVCRIFEWRWPSLGFGAHPYPCLAGYPGHEGVAEIMVSRSPAFEAGQLVLTVSDGTYDRMFADYQVLPGRCALPVDPEQVPVHVLMAQQLGSVVHALRRFWPWEEGGRTAVVVGTCSAGLLFVRMLKYLGFTRVVAVDREPDRLALATNFGADATALVTADARGEAVRALTDGENTDLAVDASGTGWGRRIALAAASRDGQVGLYGASKDDAAAVLRGPFHQGRVTAIGVDEARREPSLGPFAEALRLIQDGHITAREHVTHLFEFEEIAEALAIARDRDDGVVKVGITFD
ncbi:zinc-binding dehydrogenase [Streptomyces sp. MspMP-M5]|uniref:zinc-binding dehydrogenase n=1 Tax=unclassified Streptomyces TaxID=2593676 RepID=UPI001F3865C7|nr:zinc-binding dehydrogenase [Streptomyces sp. MspMP-M5]